MSMNAEILLPAVSVLLGSLFIALSIPLVQRRVSPNRCYGLRIPATFADETVWYEANARAGSDLLKLGLLLIAVGAGLYLLKMPSGVEVLLWFVIVEGGVIGLLIRNWRFANRLLEKQQSSQGEDNPASRLP